MLVNIYSNFILFHFMDWENSNEDSLWADCVSYMVQYK